MTQDQDTLESSVQDNSAPATTKKTPAPRKRSTSAVKSTTTEKKKAAPKKTDTSETAAVDPAPAKKASTTRRKKAVPAQSEGGQQDSTQAVVSPAVQEEPKASTAKKRTSTRKSSVVKDAVPEEQPTTTSSVEAPEEATAEPVVAASKKGAKRSSASVRGTKKQTAPAQVSLAEATDDSSAAPVVKELESDSSEKPRVSDVRSANRRTTGGSRKQAEAGTRGKKRSPRGKGAQEDIVFQPEAFADIYPSLSESILPFTVPVQNDLEDEDDGPQPALPNQPSLAQTAAELAEEDLAALDEQINGNRIVEPKSSRPDRNNARNDKRQMSGKAPGKRQGQHQEKGQAHKQQPVAPKNVKQPEKQQEKQVEKASVPASVKRVLYVSEIPDEQVEVVITENGKVTEYFVEMAHQAKIRGNIYKGVINNVDTNLQAAFVNFGCGKNGFLQIDEVHPEYWLTYHDNNKGPKYPPIQKVLKVGQEVLVQVVKEPSGTKGAFLTTWISLAGRYLVLTPGQEQIGVSRKVEDPQERGRLKELLSGIQPGEDLGVIIRTASEGASKTSIQKDLQFLKRRWRELRKKATSEKSPCLIHQEEDLATRAVRDYLADDIQEIWVDSAHTLESIKETTDLLYPRRSDMVRLHQDSRQTLWERFNLQRQLEEVASREVVLPSGGRLVFDQTEALMAIDINSGKTQGKNSFEDMVFRTNMEATEAIARHLRLRDIGGQVVIDFIEMRDRNHCRDVEKSLRNAMRTDRARHDIGRMSTFGLLELVRQRTGTSAISLSSEPCPHCRGTGVRRNMEWQALHALRDLQAKLSKLNQGKNKTRRNEQNGNGNGHSPTFLYETSYELGMYLLNKKRDRLSELETKFSTHIEIAIK